MEPSQEQVADPPTYADTVRRSSQRSQAGAPRRIEHTYTLNSSKGVPWAKLAVYSRAQSPSHLPTFYEGEPITGYVSLMLEKEETIKSVTISVIGQLTSSMTDVFLFLDTSRELWSVSMGDPSNPVTNAPVKYTGKLRGNYRWPFSISIPAHVTTRSADGGSEAWRIPPSFSERMSRIHIQYQIVCQLRRGKFRVDSKLSTVFAFTPVIIPQPFSDARRLAYLNNTALPGPDMDPDGWQEVQPIQLQGVVFSVRAVELRITLWLAKPLCYTRGSVIPCNLAIECLDTQALHLLSAPKAIDIRLRRHVFMGLANASNTNTRMSKHGVEFGEEVEDIRASVWWLSRDGTMRRTLSGEIHLARDLKPTSKIGKFELYVSHPTSHLLPGLTLLIQHEVYGGCVSAQGCCICLRTRRPAIPSILQGRVSHWICDWPAPQELLTIPS
ncbi:hypothetical protein K474DRAFT_1601787 [Panus rudis PR-1116 ss-1]|nr:hypothetical protein K474DRAFT_1601787 [Panus rudis PR-1116 ss-1]